MAYRSSMHGRAESGFPLPRRSYDTVVVPTLARGALLAERILQPDARR
jgi:hypothetical protein